MPRIATCGNCQERVTVPEGMEEGESVRCPLCQAVYSLSEVPAEAADADDSEMPPELVSVAEVSEAGPPAEAKADAEEEEGSESEEETAAEETDSAEDVTETGEGATEAGEGATEAGEEPPEPAAPEPPVQVRCPHCEAEYPLSQVVVVATGAELGPAMAAAVARHVLPGEGPASEPPALDVWAKADGVPQIDLGEATRPEAVTDHSSAFDFARQDADREAGPTGATALRPRRRKQKSMARELAGWVFGGVAGLVIAYYLLNFIRGESGNFLEIPLPGVSHTYQHSPDWFPGWMKAAPESEEDASDEIADLSEVFRPALQEDAGGSEPPAFPVPKTEPAGTPPSAGPYSGLGGATPPPQPRTFPDGYVGLASPPSYTSDELGEALKAVEERVGEKSEPISEEAYRKWCRLAEVVTFTQRGPGAEQLRDRKAAARALLAKIGQGEANLDKIGFLAGKLCMAGNRPSNGILLAGRVISLASEGNAHGAQVELAASGRTILVAGKRPLPAKEGESVLILGRIVDHPAENLVGFKTQQSLVVWAGLTVTIEP